MALGALETWQASSFSGLRPSGPGPEITNLSRRVSARQKEAEAKKAETRIVAWWVQCWSCVERVWEGESKGTDREPSARCGYGDSKDAMIITLRYQGKDYLSLKGILSLNTHQLPSNCGRQRVGGRVDGGILTGRGRNESPDFSQHQKQRTTKQYLSFDFSSSWIPWGPSYPLLMFFLLSGQGVLRVEDWHSGVLQTYANSHL